MESVLPSNKVLKRKYKILNLVGQGGYGNVYKASDLHNKIFFAIKECYFTTPKHLEQYHREASLLSTLHHPSLPRYLDSFFYNKRFYFVTDFIEGQSLKGLVESRGPLEPLEFVDWAIQVGEALYHLHNHEPPILHRDVKPANIIVTGKKAYLVDFGLAKIAEEITATVAQAVTSGFSAPEQYGQGSTDTRSDIYSFAATVYYMLTADIPQESVQRIQEDLVPESIRIQPGDIELKSIIERGMEIKPVNRWQSIEDLVNRLYKLKSRLTQKPLPDISQVTFEEKPSRTYIDQKQLNGRIVNIVRWNGSKNDGIYHVVRKNRFRPKSQYDGVFWEVSGGELIDDKVPNGTLTYYMIYKLNDGVFSDPIGIGPLICLGDVQDLRIRRDKNNAITLNWRSPGNVAGFVIRKSYLDIPVSPTDGDVVQATIVSSNGLDFNATDTTITSRAPLYYSVFCRYMKAQDIWLTSRGIGVLAE